MDFVILTCAIFTGVIFSLTTFELVKYIGKAGFVLFAEFLEYYAKKKQ